MACGLSCEKVSCERRANKRRKKNEKNVFPSPTSTSLVEPPFVSSFGRNSSLCLQNANKNKTKEFVFLTNQNRTCWSAASATSGSLTVFPSTKAPKTPATNVARQNSQTVLYSDMYTCRPAP